MDNWKETPVLGAGDCNDLIKNFKKVIQVTL